LLLVVVSRQVSRLTFGTEQHATAISILSIAVFCKLVSGGQTALIQGMRRIVDLAKLNVIGAIAGAGIGIGLVYVFRENGIVPYLVAVAATTIFSSWWYSRRIRVPSQPVTVSQIGREARALLRLGVAFMISSMMTLGVAYAVRVAVLHKLGFEATGLYQCAWTLGGLYVGFILQAMAADFYPRLTGSINDHPIANRLVNEQARVGLLLAGPGVIGTLTFAPIVIALLYSSRFNSAVPTLRWVCLGATLQVVTWPMGFIIVAKGRQNLFIFAEVAWAVASLVLAWVGISLFGVTGAGIAFFASYVFHAVLVYPIARHLSGFRWSRENIRTGLLFLSLIALVFWTSQALPPLWGQLAGAVAAICAGVYSIRVLNRVVNTEELPRVVRRLLGVLRLHGEAQKAQS